MNFVMTQVLSGIGWLIYANFFEWFWHRYFMHKPRFPILAYKGHTIVHHSLYKGETDYFCYTDRRPANILLKPYALPALLCTHIPLMLLCEHLIPHTFWGALIATLTYFVVYEYLHWNMHVPRGHFVERFRWFQYLRNHHKLHHTHHQKNFSVLFPLPDLLFGTFATEADLAEQRKRRDVRLEQKHAQKLEQKSEQKQDSTLSIANKID